VASRKSALLCLVLLTCALLPQVRPSMAVSPPLIGLGYDPATVQSVANGIPVYTVGDQMWIQSYYFNTTALISLQNPRGEIPSGLITLDPGQVYDVYTFGATDLPGQWTLSITTSYGNFNVPFTLVLTNMSLIPRFMGSSLSDNVLNQAFELPQTSAYDVQACTMGQSLGNTVIYGLQGGRNGSIDVSLGENSTRVSVSQVSYPLAVWLELYSPYSYVVGGGGLVSQNLLVSATKEFTISPPSTGVVLQWVDQMPLHYGRFNLRIYLRTTSGLSLYEAPFLRTSSGEWIALTDCTSMINVSSEAFTLSTSLDASNSTWPRQLYTMYDLGGVESYSVTPVAANETAIHLTDYPFHRPLTGVAINASALGVEEDQWDAYDSTVYLLAPSFPITVSIGLSFGGVVTEIVNATITAPYWPETISIRAGTLQASVFYQGKAVANATFSLSAPGTTAVEVEPNSLGTLSIQLPPGDYTVSASYHGTSTSEPVDVAVGQTSSATLELNPPPFPTLLYLLIGVAVAAALANILAWRQYLLRRRAYG
jgi:hypothetical protein